MTYCQSITRILRTIWVRCIPLSLRSRTRRRATPLLPTWIYSCRSRVTVSCALPFTTNVTISTSTSQTFRSWVAIFLLRQPMVFLSHSSYGMPGLAPLMHVLFLGRHVFHLSSSDRDMSWNVWNRPSGSFMVDMGISSNIMKSPSPKCYMTFWDRPYTITPSIDQALHQYANLLPNWTLLPILTLLPNFGGFHRTLQRVRLANRGRLLLRTPGPVPFGTSICSNVETILSWTCHVYGPFEFRTSLGTSILFVKWKMPILKP